MLYLYKTPYRIEKKKFCYMNKRKGRKEQVIFSDVRVDDRAVTAFSLEDELIDRAVSYRTRQIA